MTEALRPGWRVLAAAFSCESDHDLSPRCDADWDAWALEVDYLGGYLTAGEYLRRIREHWLRWLDEKLVASVASTLTIDEASSSSTQGRRHEQAFAGDATGRARARNGRLELFRHDLDPYVMLPADTHRECWPIRSTAFRRWLSQLYFGRLADRSGIAGAPDALGCWKARPSSRAPTGTFICVSPPTMKALSGSTWATTTGRRSRSPPTGGRSSPTRRFGSAAHAGCCRFPTRRRREPRRAPPVRERPLRGLAPSSSAGSSALSVLRPVRRSVRARRAGIGEVHPRQGCQVAGRPERGTRSAGATERTGPDHRLPERARRRLRQRLHASRKTSPMILARSRPAPASAHASSTPTLTR